MNHATQPVIIIIHYFFKDIYRIYVNLYVRKAWTYTPNPRTSYLAL